MYIYQADTYCDDCGSKICEDLVKSGKANGIIPWDELVPRDNDALVWFDNARKGDPDALVALWDEFNFDPRYDTTSIPFELDESSYDSDDYPKYGKPEATDSPDHCGSGADCLNAIRLDDGTKIGELLSTELTEDGKEYVYRALRGDWPKGAATRNRHESIRLTEMAKEERSLVVLYWMANIDDLSFPKDLYTVKLDNSDDDPFRINCYVHGPYADEWADSVGALSCRSSWETCDGPEMVYDIEMWSPDFISGLESEGFDLDLSEYCDPEEEDLAVGAHMRDCEDCQDHWDFEKGKEHYESTVASHEAFRAKAHAFLTSPLVYVRAYHPVLPF